MIDKIANEADQKMKKSVEITQTEIATVHTGRASRSLVEGIKVDYYSSFLPLKQLANISIPEARFIIIQPWDPSSLEAIEKSIMKADLGFVPTNDGKLIRISIPQLTQERRDDLVKVVKNIAEEGKISIRSIRRDTNEKIKKAKAQSEISEDEEYKFHEKIQNLTDKYIKELDDILEHKQKEIREI